MKRVMLLYNPDSGDNRIAWSLNDIISIYQENGLCITPYILSFDGRDADFIRGLDGSYHHVLIAGGDGTVNHVVNIMMHSGIDCPVALIPAGTANDFANLMGFPCDIPQACREIISGEILEVDLGRVNDRYFVNAFSCGLFTDVSQKTPTIMKNTFGKLAYYFSGIGEFPNFKRLHLRVSADGREVFCGSSLIFFVFNGKTAGNLRIAYLSDIRDGLLDILVVRGENINGALRTIFHYMSGNTGTKYPGDIIHVQGRNIAITSSGDESTDIDGQPGPSFPVEITCVPRALKIICPKKTNLRAQKKIWAARK